MALWAHPDPQVVEETLIDAVLRHRLRRALGSDAPAWLRTGIAECVKVSLEGRKSPRRKLLAEGFTERELPTLSVFLNEPVVRALFVSEPTTARSWALVDLLVSEHEGLLSGLLGTPGLTTTAAIESLGGVNTIEELLREHQARLRRDR